MPVGFCLQSFQVSRIWRALIICESKPEVISIPIQVGNRSRYMCRRFGFLYQGILSSAARRVTMGSASPVWAFSLRRTMVGKGETGDGEQALRAVGRVWRCLVWCLLQESAAEGKRRDGREETEEKSRALEGGCGRHKNSDEDHTVPSGSLLRGFSRGGKSGLSGHGTEDGGPKNLDLRGTDGRCRFGSRIRHPAARPRVVSEPTGTQQAWYA